MDDNFKVVYPGSVLAHFKELCLLAKAGGFLDEVEKAARIIHSRLQESPLTFGDPYFSAGQLQVLLRAVAPLVVHYAVHEAARTVFVREIVLMSA